MTTVQPDTLHVRRAGEGERAAVAATLAAAFRDDPVFAWIHPDPVERADRTQFFFDLAVEVLAQHDDTWAAGPDVAGAALWVPHGSAPMSDEEGEAFGGALAERAGADAERLLALMTVMEEHHPHEPHEYLWFVGVRPGRQGLGIGSATMAPVLARADRAGHPAYLEATSARSKALYERQGFVAATPISVADSPPLWPMWRDPRPT
ncbi:GNAT family N-acetyltransferase [Pseudonocardia halophobica]|uniref:N-acetyltransferase n=1 Tax=Pseudonocardia halophobica TaxID=29401 RepID=A0A9W6L9C7_9PSEU|nr:GNAT family N-acetyltransferase [Pseudonocardia halophobica]GLL15075.1 N-acetyltransferase [Pseudonocardia halophobica]